MTAGSTFADPSLGSETRQGGSRAWPTLDSPRNQREPLTSRAKGQWQELPPMPDKARSQ